jgi:hypothetical protein
MRVGPCVAVSLVLLAGGALAAGCGGSDSSTGAGAGTATTSTTEGTTADGVYEACLEATQQGPAAGAIGAADCRHARDAFSECLQRADDAPNATAREAAVTACQQTAEAATSALQAGG